MSLLLNPSMRKSCLLLVLWALAFSLLIPFSCAFLSREEGGVSSSRALLKLSRGEGLGRRRPLFLVAESSPTELVLATK